METQESVLRLECSLEISKENQDKQEFFKVLKYLKPTWKIEDLVIKDLSGGFLNFILRCYLDSDPEDSVVFRFWSKSATEYFAEMIDRRMEVALHERIGELGIGPKLLATFKNGVCCEYFKGEKLLAETCKTNEFARIIARKLAEVHGIQIEGFQVRPKAFMIIESGLEGYPPQHSDPEKNKSLQKELPPRDEVVKEVKFLKTLEKELDLTVVQCHGDIHSANILYNKDTGILKFLDFELAHIGYQAEELAYFFLSLTFDYDNLGKSVMSMPEESFQHKFLRWYLEKWFEINGKSASDVTDKDIEKLFIQVNKFSLISSFYFGMTSVNLCRIDSKADVHPDLIESNMLDFSLNQFRRYFAMKEELIALKLPE